MSSRRWDRGALVWGAIFTVIGVTFLLQEADVWRVRADVFLPVLLVVAGVVLVFGGLMRRGTDR
jgi:membrane protein DedA with SNARE-associated domain